MKFLVSLELDLPPLVFVREVPDDYPTPSRFEQLVGDLDHVRPAAYDCLVAELAEQLADNLDLKSNALDEFDLERAESGILLVELYALYAVPEDAFTLDLDEAAAALFLAHGIEPRLWGWTIRTRAGDADTA